MRNPHYSIVVPVFNRPQEVDELLSSLLGQTLPDFEVIVVEDGSTVPCDHVVDRYRDALDIHYVFKPNSGPGPSRNVGFSVAKGEYLVVFDSDCLVPPRYFEALQESIGSNHWDAWGGPDRAHEDFTAIQRAMGYTMSSFLTTGGIRGGTKRIGWFQPRSFNMGMTRHVFDVTGGFKLNRYAEDIELSVRIRNAGFKIGLVPDAFVYHKRRTNFMDFFKQVYNFGKGRVIVGRLHPDEIRLTHWFPAIFLLGVASTVIISWVSKPLFIAAAFIESTYLISILGHAYLTSGNFKVALLAVPSALLQLSGYGAGFLTEKLKLAR